MSDYIADVDEGELGPIHSRLGPSSANRWLNCKGSPNLIAKLPPSARTGSLPANEGSAAHTLFARCLLEGTDAWMYSGQDIHLERDGVKLKFKVGTDEGCIDPIAVQQSVEWVRARVVQLRAAGHEVFCIVEQSVVDSEDPEAFGTADVVIIVPGVMLIVPDFKYGKGVTVEPSEEQTRLYAHYAFSTFKSYNDIIGVQSIDGKIAANGHQRTELLFTDTNTPVELWILQPRIPHPKGCERKYVTTRNEIGRWFYGEVIQAMAETRDPNTPLTMGEWCRFCPANGATLCPAIHEFTSNLNLDMNPIALSDAQLGEMIMKLEQAGKLQEKLEAEAFNRAMAGRKVKFFKLVRKLADRVWKSGAKDAIDLVYGEEAYTKPALRSPAQIQTLPGGKAITERWSMKPPTGLTLAKESDKREAASADRLADFEKAGGNVDGSMP